MKIDVVCFTSGNRSYISDNAFKEADLVKTEKLILETLNYELCYVTPIHFVHRYCEAANSKQEGFLSFVKYALEVASVEYVCFFCKQKPLLNF